MYIIQFNSQPMMRSAEFTITGLKEMCGRTFVMIAKAFDFTAIADKCSWHRHYKEVGWLDLVNGFWRWAHRGSSG